MEIAPTTEAEVLEQFVARLIEKVTGLGQQNCYFADNPIPQQLPEGDLIVTVTAGDSSYPEPFTTGGGLETLNQQSSAVITVLRRSHLDEPTQVRAALFDRGRGLLKRLKPAILNALLVNVCQDESGAAIRLPWMPTNGEGTPILRNQTFPTNCTSPRPVQIGSDGVSWIGFTITFSVNFDWVLDG